MIVISEDTDVFVMLLVFCTQISGRLLLRRKKSRIIDISRLANTIGKDACTALLGVYAWTGRDSVSVYTYQGKMNTINLILSTDTFREAFSRLGEEWNVTEELFSTLERFACSMYSLISKSTTMNDLRYKIFRSRNGLNRSL
jgi:hypothetical protein